MPVEDFIDRKVKNVIYDNNLGRSNIPIISSAVTEILGSPVASGLKRNKNVVPPLENENSLFKGSKLALSLVQKAINASGLTVVHVNPTITYSKAGSQESGSLVSLGANLLSGGTVDVLGTLGLTGDSAKKKGDPVFKARSDIDKEVVPVQTADMGAYRTSAWKVGEQVNKYDYKANKDALVTNEGKTGSLAQIAKAGADDDTILTYNKVFGDASKFEMGNEVNFAVLLKRIDGITHSSIPDTPFSDIADGWMPVQTFNIERKRLNSENLSLFPGVSLPVPTGYEYSLSFSMQLVDTDDRSVYRFFDNYLKAIAPLPYQVLPYKNACMKICVYILNRQKDKVYSMGLYGFPEIQQNFATTGSDNPPMLGVNWKIVGEEDIVDHISEGSRVTTNETSSVQRSSTAAAVVAADQAEG